MQSTRSTPQGFALIIALALMAFIFLLLVSLSVHVQIQNQGNTRTLQNHQAKLNARFGVLVAVANLQKFAGPDQRVTARADILKENDIADHNDNDDVDEVNPALSNFTVNVNDTNRNWIGVWVSSEPRTIPDTTNAGAHELNPVFPAYDSDNRKAQPITFLVSGKTAWDTNSDGILVDSEYISAMETAIPSVGTNGKLNATDQENYVVLVGAGSVDTDTDPNNAVVAGKETLPNNTGSYAWWVADESLKAKYNLVEHPDFATTFGANQYAVRNTAPTFNGIDAMTYTVNPTAPTPTLIRFSDHPSGNLYDKTDTGFLDRLRKLFSWANIGNVEPAMKEPITSGGTDSPIQQRFHDLTIHSTGLLVDVKAGALKEDLSTYLFHGAVGTLTDTTPIYSDTRFGTETFGNGGTGRFADLNWGLNLGDRGNTEDRRVLSQLFSLSNHNIPRFGLLRNWSDLGASPQVQAHQSVSSNASHGLYPVVTHFQMPVSVTLKQATPPTYSAVVAFHPLITLYNPHNIDLPTQDYLLVARLFSSTSTHQIRVRHPTASTTEFRDINDSGNSLPYTHSSELQNANLHSSNSANIAGVHSHVLGTSTGPGRVILRLRNVSIPAGSVQIFTADTDRARDTSPLIPIGTGSAQLIERYKGVVDMQLGSVADYRSNGAFGFETDTVELVQYTSSGGTWTQTPGPIPLVLGSTPSTFTLAQGAPSNTQPYLFFHTKAPTDTNWNILSASAFPELTAGTMTFFSEGYTASTDINEVKLMNRDNANPSWANSRPFPFYFSMRTITSLIRAMSVGNEPGIYSFRRGLGMYNYRGILSKHPFAKSGGTYDIIHSIYSMVTATNYENEEFGQDIDQFEASESALFSSSHLTGASTADVGDELPIFYVPPSKEDLVSLGQLQHIQFLPSSNAPTYQFGNSYAHPMVLREGYSGFYLNALPPTSDDLVARYPFPANTSTANGDEPLPPTNSTPNHFQNSMVDVSYLTNEALWDRFFLSGINGSLTAAQLNQTEPLPNPRLKVIEEATAFYGPSNSTSNNEKFTLGSRYMGIDGAFNVNSTSVEAWKAMLSSLDETMAVSASETPSAGRVAFPRIPVVTDSEFDPSGGSYTFGAGEDSLAYTGYRVLTDTEITHLAERIVDEVKLRGPFLSVSDFVNRRLISASDDLSGNRGLGLRGALQSAIDRASLDATGANPTTEINGKFWSSVTRFQKTEEAINDDRRLSGDNLPPYFNIEHTALGEEFYTTAADIPGYLTQADILQKIGSFITVRGDTFVVRAYGDTQNPITGEVLSGMYCEAVVQRTTEAIEEDPTYLQRAAGNFGRRFKIISFRWLNPDEI